VKHISVIACLFAAGESLTPDMMTSQDSPSFREQLKKRGVRFGTDLIMKSNGKPSINADIFLDYVQTVFLSNLAGLRGLDGFPEEMPVSLMENCPGHITCVVM
jgi:cobalamin biosynthesis Co2+ chelatase CbiK